MKKIISRIHWKKGKQHLGHKLEELQGKIGLVTLQKLQIYEQQARKEYGLGALDTLFLLHHEEKSMVELARMVQISSPTLARVFDALNLPRLSMKEASKRAVIKYNSSFTSEQHRERMRKASGYVTPEQLRERGRKLYASFAALTSEQKKHIRRLGGLRTQALLTHEERSRRAKKFSASRTPEWRRKRAIKARLAIGRQPNVTEKAMITILQELGVYARDAASAQEGQVYYADGKENKRCFRSLDGRYFIPDFKVKGHNIVFEIYGDLWHSRAFNEPLGRPEYTWKPEKKIAIYAEIGILCKVYWEHELQDQIRREEIKQEVLEIIAACEQELT